MTINNNSEFPIKPYALKEGKRGNVFLKGNPITQNNEYRVVPKEQPSIDDNGKNTLSIQNDLICQGKSEDNQFINGKPIDEYNNEQVNKLADFLLNKYAYPKSSLSMQPAKGLPHLEVKDRIRVNHDNKWDRDYFVKGIKHKFEGGTGFSFFSPRFDRRMFMGHVILLFSSHKVHAAFSRRQLSTCRKGFGRCSVFSGVIGPIVS